MGNLLQTKKDDELVFSNVNVWIPKEKKRLAFLPLDMSNDVDYPLCAGDRKRLETDLAGCFQSFRSGLALVFFGQSILHQALIGPEFDCSGGSVEGRYLTLSTRKLAHDGSLRNCVSNGVGISEDVNTNFDVLEDVDDLRVL